MYFTWVFISLNFIYVLVFLCFGLGNYLPLGFMALWLLWLADFLLAVKQPEPEVRRNFPDPVYQNQDTRVEISVTNRSSRAMRVYFKDEPPFSAKVSRIQEWLVLPPNSSATFSYQLSISKRGVFEFGDLNLRRSGYLLMFNQQYKIPLKQKIKVFPVLSKVNACNFNKFLNAESAGEHRARLFNMNGELAQLREYVPGDDYRKINWKVTAHTGKPVINEFKPEKDQNVFLFFDTGRLLFDQLNENASRFDFILDSAILLAYNILEHGDMVGALSFNYRVEQYLPAGKGLHQLQIFVNHFFNIEAHMIESDYAAAFSFWQKQHHKRSLLFVYADFTDFESSKELLQYLKVIGRHHIVVCIMVEKRYLTELANKAITDEADLYRIGVALELQAERNRIKKMLKTLGINVLEVGAGNISRSVVEHYLYLKHSGLF